MKVKFEKIEYNVQNITYTIYIFYTSITMRKVIESYNIGNTLTSRSLEALRTKKKCTIGN